MGTCWNGKRVHNSTKVSVYKNAGKEYSLESFLKHEDIKEHFELDKVIGVGSFGTVRKGYLKSNEDLEVAVKSISKTKFYHQETLKQFKSEIDILISVDHPNIIKLHGAFEDTRYIHIVTEYCEGGELYERIMSKGHYLEEESREVMRSVLLAVSHLHKNGICHRDLKPENFMFVTKEEQSNLKLIDFGLSKRFSSLKENELKTIVGTPYYIAPEIIKRDKYNYKCDMWSVGAILYTLLSGHIPFPGKDIQSVFYKIRTGSYDVNELSLKGISEDAKDLLKKLLMVNPSKRISAEKALKHRWFKKALSGKLCSVDPEILRSLLSYNCKYKFKKQVSFMLMKYFTYQDIQNLRDLLTKLDLDKDGQLTINEIKKAIVGNLPCDIKKSFDEFKAKKYGKIKYLEFIEATLRAKHEIAEDEVWNDNKNL